ncbi:MAG: hypothetical protein CL878_15840 [Dehalococcoidia bacterium]|nr:hypothetical protein [Dehalococcoidia bacterium]
MQRRSSGSAVASDPYLSEVLEQPQRLAALGQLWPRAASAARAMLAVRSPTRVICTGMGASLAAAYPAALYLNQHGVPTWWTDTSELLHFGADGVSPQTLVVVISQSGETVEAVRLVERLGGRAPLVAITNDPDSSLAHAADVVLEIACGVEHSISTKTYTASLVVMHRLARLLVQALSDTETEDASAQGLAALVAATDDAVGQWQELASMVGRTLGDATHYIVFGRGPSVASAQTGALIVKEGGRVPAEGMTAAGLRHGPLEMVGACTGCIAFAPASPVSPLTVQLAEEMHVLGAPTVVVSSAAEPALSADLPALHLPPVDAWLAPVLEIVPVQLLVWELARRQGREPGVFARIGKVTTKE